MRDTITAENDDTGDRDLHEDLRLQGAMTIVPHPPNVARRARPSRIMQAHRSILLLIVKKKKGGKKKTQQTPILRTNHLQHLQGSQVQREQQPPKLQPLKGLQLINRQGPNQRILK